MQLTLNQSEITQAITAYIRNAVSVNDGMEIRIDLKATRGDQGHSAIVDIVPAGTPVAAPLDIANKVKRAYTRKATTAAAEGQEGAETEETGEAQSEEEQPAEEAQKPAADEAQEEPAAEEQQVEEVAAPAPAPAPAAVVKPVVKTTPAVSKTAAPAPVAGARPSLFAGLQKKASV